MTAKAHGIDEECQTILEASGLTEDQINLPTMGKPLQPPSPVVLTYKANWPVKAASHSFFEKALLGEAEGDDDEAPITNGVDHGDAVEEEGATRDGQVGEEEDEDAAGWDMGDDINVEVEPDFVNVDSAIITHTALLRSKEENILLREGLRRRQPRMMNRSHEALSLKHTMKWPPSNTFYRNEGILCCRMKHEIVYMDQG